MYEVVLRQMRGCIDRNEMIIPRHALEQMYEDDLERPDVKQVIRSGQIVERQRDVDTREWKYVIEGTTYDGLLVRVVAKIGPDKKLYLITVMAL